MDERLTWNPEDFGGISHIYVLRSNVWVPDITPFDSIKLLSYSFYNEHIEMEAGLYPSVNVDTVGNDEWEVTSIIPHSEVRYNDSDMVQINEYTFRLKRNPSYYIALIIIPSFMLTFLCVAGLFTSPLQVDDLDKFSMGLTTIMSTTVMIGIVAENIPKTKQAPQLTTYVTTNLIIVSVAIMLVIIIPKITQFFSWIARRRQIHILRTYGYLANGVMNATFLLIFEGYVSKNLYDLVALKYAKK
ncbi:unnamed protein product [Nippostrongylus brasiliensis]|uniref:Neur_chan_LBD domain-containing protein n=1 Tax=Nippostrongylus brasiliensis TaxID=27835 RepID=A0A0N4XUJ7_NIPBR|nr:unnamed protein product [Nippostrongylus brasiliensis]